MGNITDISDGSLNKLHETLLSLLIDVTDHATLQGKLYRSGLLSGERLKYTYTIQYLSNILASGLAKLYMIMGHTKGEITSKELQENLEGIRNDMMVKDIDSLYLRHAKLVAFISKSEELNTRIDRVSTGGVYYEQDAD